MIELFFKLVIGHFITDYPLQADFLAKAKNHKAPIAGVLFYQALFAHAAIQAGVVWAITGSSHITLYEFFLHASIDYLKCDGKLNFNQDQFLHLLCKAIYVGGLILWQ